jgi:hypothetical protein
MKPSAVIFDTMAREVQKQLISNIAILEEAFNCFTGNMRGLINQGLYIVATNMLVKQDLAERVRIGARCPEPAQSRVTVFGGCDD